MYESRNKINNKVSILKVMLTFVYIWSEDKFIINIQKSSSHQISIFLTIFAMSFN